MNDHVTKPIAPERLLATLARWVPPKLGAPAAPPADGAPADLAPDVPPQPCPPELLALASLDAREGIRRIGGKADAYRRQLARFRDNYADAGATLATLIGAGQLAEADNLCHALVGVAGNMGATTLFTQLGVVGTLLKQGRVPPPGALGTLEAALAALLADIDSLAASAAAPARSGEPVLADAAMLALLDKLAAALEYDLGRAAALLAELRAGTVGTDAAAAIAAIAARADAFAIDEAVALVRALRQRYGEHPAHHTLYRKSAHES
jgi:two-component system sensor histidine kinase/response regulator